MAAALVELDGDRMLEVGKFSPLQRARGAAATRAALQALNNPVESDAYALSCAAWAWHMRLLLMVLPPSVARELRDGVAYLEYGTARRRERVDQ